MPSSEIVLSFRNRGSWLWSFVPQLAKWRELEREGNCERRDAAGSYALDPCSSPVGHGVFRLQGHHPQGGQEFLLRVSRPSATQTRSSVRCLRLHAALRRHYRRSQVEFARAPSKTRHLAGRSAPRPDRKSTRLNSSHMSISYAVF